MSVFSWLFPCFFQRSKGDIKSEPWEPKGIQTQPTIGLGADDLRVPENLVSTVEGECRRTNTMNCPPDRLSCGAFIPPVYLLGTRSLSFASSPTASSHRSPVSHPCAAPTPSPSTTFLGQDTASSGSAPRFGSATPPRDERCAGWILFVNAPQHTPPPKGTANLWQRVAQTRLLCASHGRRLRRRNTPFEVRVERELERERQRGSLPPAARAPATIPGTSAIAARSHGEEGIVACVAPAEEEDVAEALQEPPVRDGYARA
jgi:hypothetical protein